MNRLEVLKREAEGMLAALDELNIKIGAAEAQRESIAILLDAIESAVRGIEAEPKQLELPFTDDNVIAFPAHGSN
jgi:hypothetical protein